MERTCGKQDENSRREIENNAEIVRKRGKRSISRSFEKDLQNGGWTDIDVWNGTLLGRPRGYERYITEVVE